MVETLDPFESLNSILVEHPALTSLEPHGARMIDSYALE